MRNCTELRVELAELYANLKAGDVKGKDAGELANIAGKMINSAKAQIEYYALRKEKPTISFLGDDNASTDGVAKAWQAQLSTKTHKISDESPGVKRAT